MPPCNLSCCTRAHVSLVACPFRGAWRRVFARLGFGARREGCELHLKPKGPGPRILDPERTATPGSLKVSFGWGGILEVVASSGGEDSLKPAFSTAWRGTARHGTAWHGTALHDTAPHHITSYRIASHRITSHHIASNHITSHHITSHHITSHHITSPRLASPRLASHHSASRFPFPS